LPSSHRRRCPGFVIAGHSGAGYAPARDGTNICGISIRLRRAFP
jgi:hypothetical protein